MIKINIPVKNNIELMMCDVYLNVDIKLLPMIPPHSKLAEITLTELNTRLKQVGYEIAAMVSERLEETLKEYEIK